MRARVEVDAKHGAAGGPGDARREQPEQPQPDDRHPLAHLGLGQAEAVQGDGAQGGEGGRFKIDVLGQVRQQVARNDGVLGVDGIAAAGAGHPVAHLETLHAFAQRATIVPAEE